MRAKHEHVSGIVSGETIDFPIAGILSRRRCPGSDCVKSKQRMSLGHSEVSFNHSCLKVPVHSLSRRPAPKYERPSTAKRSETEQTEKRNSLSALYNNFKSVKSYLEFYESIPDYSELHHLSNEEFYSRLKSLKITQKRFCGESGVLSCGNTEDDEFGGKVKKTGAGRKESSLCACCSLCSSNKDYCCGVNGFKNDSKICDGSEKQPPKINVSDNDNASDFYDHEVKKLSGYEADQESSTLQLGEKPRKGFGNDGDESGLGNCSRGSRSKAISPAWECDAPEFCQKLSEISFRNEGCHSICCASENDNLLFGKKPKKPLSRPIPLTSRILLFDKLMMEKEARRRIIHDRYSEELRSIVKPFSFTKREEAKERLRMIASNPELNTMQPSLVRFKARPVPRNLFSNYAYERMKEDEFYRALRRRVRAEELLKSSSLPPSMALRERCRSKSLDFLDYRCPKKSWIKACGYRRACKNIKKEIELDEASKKAPQKRKTRSGWMSTTRRVNSATDSSTEISPYESVLEPANRQKGRPHSSVSCSRNNLASVLRIETARKRLEKESEDKMRESRLRHQAQFKARLARMNPAWRSLSCDKNEDLALRVAARREEERLKKKNHQKLMESIYGRVYSMPPMFHNERFHKMEKTKSEKEPVENLYNDANDKTNVENFAKSHGFSPSPKHLENSRSRESFYSTPSCEKIEKVKQYESDDTL